jgi:hypothetical protein
MTIKFEIKNRWTDEVAFTAEIEADDATPYGVKVCKAVLWAIAAGVALTNLNLDRCDFSGVEIRDSSFDGSRFVRSSFDGSSFVRSSFDGSSFVRSSFVDSRFDGSSFVDSRFVRSSFVDSSFDGANIIIPKIENIHQAVYNFALQEGNFDMGSWHHGGACGTAHCRAGTVNHLAGEAGMKLEGQIGPSGAAALIYFASDPTMKTVPNFSAIRNEDALADMKRMAEEEAARAKP